MNKNKFFFDTEFFVADGLPVSIVPISIGMVSLEEHEVPRVRNHCSCGYGPCPHDLEVEAAGTIKVPRKYYALFEGAREAASKTSWLRENVLPHLSGPELPAAVVAEQIREFIGADRPEFIASYGVYDWVVLAQLFGGLLHLPAHWPWVYTESVLMGLPRVERVGAEHNALADALTLRKAYCEKFGK